MKKEKSRKKSLFVWFIKWTFISSIGLIFLLIMGGIGFYQYISKDLPKLDSISDYKPYQVAEVFDANGKKIGEFWKEVRYLTPVNEIPQKLIQGFVASEDNRFFEHHGVDFFGIFRAFINNLRAGHVVQGGSTITQQITKGLILTSERTYTRKIKEAIVSTKIESTFSKDQILYLYLNHIFLGNRAYGVAAAAKNYFHKELKDLNHAEIAMIVGLSKGPAAYNPLINPERARARQHYVIDRMEEEKYLTAQEAEIAKKTPLTLFRVGTDKEFNLQYAPYFTEQVRKILVDKYGEEALYHEGWKIYTTVDLNTQRAAQKAVTQGVRGISRLSGFRGPVQSLPNQQAIEDFNRQYHLKLIESEEGIPFGMYRNMGELLKIKLPLKEDQYYLGVILEGSRTAGFQIKVGNEKGFIPPEILDWANGSEKLKLGDVVQVKLYNNKKKAPVASLKETSSAKPTKTVAKNDLKSPSSYGNVTLFSLQQEPFLQAALYSYEPFSGEVKAIVGGTDFQKSEFNRATQALRQPGSTIKPLLYAAALDKGYTPNTIIMDGPLMYEESPGKFWSPKNYGGGFSGPVSMRTALVHSKNVVTVRILMDIGTDFADAFMRKLGISTPINKYYSLALGSNEVFLSELTRAYGSFTTGGVLPDLHLIRKVVDSSGKVVEEYNQNQNKFIITWDPEKDNQKNKTDAVISETAKSGKLTVGQAKIPESQSSTESSPETTAQARHTPSTQKNIPWDEMGYSTELLQAGDQIISKDKINLSEYEKKVLYGQYIPANHVLNPRTAATMVSMLQDVVKYGTGTRALALGKPAAGKTGTTNNATDAWFIGFTPTLVTGVWVGYDEKVKTIGHNATGGHIAAPIWVAYMTEATKKYPTKNFKLPSWIDLSQYQTPMEMVQGDSEAIDSGPTQGGPSKEVKSGGGAEFFSNDL